MRVLYNGVLICFLIIMMVPPAWAWRAAGDVARANRLYEKGEFEPAITHYEQALTKDPQSMAVEYDLGTALYKKGNFSQSIAHLNKALLSDDVKLQSKAHFNLGNALYKAGIQKEKGDVNQAIGLLEKSLPHYQKTLAVDPKDGDAKFNYDFVKKELERLKRKKQNQQNQDQQQNQNKNQQGGSSSDQQKSQQKPPQNSDQPESQHNEGQSSSNRPNQDQNQKSDDKDKKPNDSKDNPSSGHDQQNRPNQTPPNDNNRQDGAGQAEGDLTPQEANMVLGDYERNEEPKQMLYFVPQKSKESAVSKDW